MKKYAALFSLLLVVLIVYGCYAPPPPAVNPQQPFSLGLSLDKTMYKIGENIVISAQASRSCYMTLYDISTEGEVTQIFPNRFASDNYIEGGYIYRIPDQKDQFDFEIVGPPGMERVRAVCTIEEVNLVESRKIDATEEFPTIYQDNPGEFDQSLNAKLQIMPSDRWAEASVTFQVLR